MDARETVSVRGDLRAVGNGQLARREAMRTVVAEINIRVIDDEMLAVGTIPGAIHHVHLGVGDGHGKRAGKTGAAPIGDEG